MPTKRNSDMNPAENKAGSLAELNRIIAAAGPLARSPALAVPGEGPIGAAMAFVGEQPGDQEDRERRPFVGPAGQLLRRAMNEAGIVPEDAYLTNAVKHFKFVQRGKRRIHQTPTAGEVRHYRWWLEQELDLVAPRVVVALGATALLALAGKALPVGRNRGETSFSNRPGFITVHPSSLLRQRGEEVRRDAWHAYVQDMRRIAEMARR